MGTRVRKTEVLDPHQQAGHSNVARARMSFAKRGTARAATVADALGLSSGTTTWAIRALVKDGSIEPTGNRIARSPEYRYVGGKRTRRGPGE